MSNEMTIATEQPSYLVDFDQASAKGNEGLKSTQLATPRMKLLQATSPELIEGSEKYVEGAKAGHFADILNKKTYGTEFLAINITMKETFVIENKFQAGGGFFGTFDNQQEAESQIESVLKENKELKAENVAVWRHHEHLLYLADDDMNLSATPVLWDLKSSAIKPSNAWNTQIISQAGHRFSYIWRVKNAKASNGSNTWFTFATELARGDSGNPLYTPENLVESIKEMLDSDSFRF